MKARIKTAVIGAFCALSFQPVQAFDQDSWGYGVYAKGGQYTIGETDGEVDDAGAAAIGAKLMLYPQSRGNRYFFAIEGGGFDLDADTEGLVNSEVSFLTAMVGWEHRFNFTRNFKVWAGAAISAGKLTAENRYDLTHDGFLNNTYSDRDETLAGVSVYADTYFDLNREGSLQLGIGPFFDMQASDGLQAVGIKLTVQRR